MDTFPPGLRPAMVPIEVIDSLFSELFTQHCLSGEKLMDLAGRGTTTFRIAVGDGSEIGRWKSGHIITMDEDLYSSIVELCSMSKPEPPITHRLETGDRPMPFYLRWLLAAAVKLTDRYS